MDGRLPVQLVVAVTGGRNYNDRGKVWKSLDALVEIHGDVRLVVGDCSGADQLAREWADERGIHKDVFVADWDKHGRAAGPIRNKVMVDFGFDLLLAFPGGFGTANMIKQTEKQGVRVKEIY